MRHLIAFLILAALLPVNGQARTHLSAHRNANESFEHAKMRNKGIVLFDEDDSDVEPLAASKDPESLAKSLSAINLKDIPDAGSYAELLNQFKFIRDTRFLEDNNFPRRLTWLFPDDGCYARAELAAEHLMKNHFITPKKVFAFGNLLAETKNAPSGAVSWWYHVAVVYRVGSQPYVLDPALNPQQPMKLTEWNKAIGGERTRVQYAICAKDTFDPEVDCVKPDPVDENMAESEQRSFLPEEWDRLLQMNRDPEQELGEKPPWL